MKTARKLRPLTPLETNLLHAIREHPAGTTFAELSRELGIEPVSQSRFGIHDAIKELTRLKLVTRDEARVIRPVAGKCSKEEDKPADVETNLQRTVLELVRRKGPHGLTHSELVRRLRARQFGVSPAIALDAVAALNRRGLLVSDANVVRAAASSMEREG